jgi:hypothetical protein
MGKIFPRSRSRAFHALRSFAGQNECQSRERSPHFSLVMIAFEIGSARPQPPQNQFQNHHHHEFLDSSARILAAVYQSLADNLKMNHYSNFTVNVQN